MKIYEKLFERNLQKLADNKALNETAILSTDIAKTVSLFTSLMVNIYDDTLVSQIASFQPISQPYGRVAALVSTYAGPSGGIIGVDNSLDHMVAVIVSAEPSATPYHAGQLIKWTTSASSATVVGSGTIQYVEHFDGSTKTALLIKSTSQASAINTTNFIYDSADDLEFKEITYVTTSRTSQKALFKNYSWKASDAGEDFSDVNYINFQVTTETIEAKSRKLISKMTQEKLQDLLFLYNTDGTELISKLLAKEVAQEIDVEVLAYLKTVAQPMATAINLDTSTGITDGVDAIANDIALNAFLCAEDIRRKTLRPANFFVLVDSMTAALLQVSNCMNRVTIPGNRFLIGFLGTYPIYVDTYSLTQYCMVGYKNPLNEVGDAGLIYAPYTSEIIKAVDPNTFNENIGVLNRYNYCLHPEGKVDFTDTSNIYSNFFKMFTLSYSATITNYYNRFIKG